MFCSLLLVGNSIGAIHALAKHKGGDWRVFSWEGGNSSSVSLKNMLFLMSINNNDVLDYFEQNSLLVKSSNEV